MILRKTKILFVVTLLLFPAWQVWGYDNIITHPKISSVAIEIFNKHAGGKLTDEQINWIVQGSIAEDADPRYINHFYNPETGSGLDDSGFKGLSAKEWAQNQSGLISFEGDYSESTILKNYQEGNYKRAYEGIGHILHLIQDMSVPAHTRNDAHPEGDPFEGWARQNGIVDLTKVNFIPVKDLNGVFDSMASFSHYNFFSKDTINLSKTQNTYFKLDGNNEFLMVDLGGKKYKLLLVDRTGLLPVYELDNFKVHLDYWNMLYPKAVGYSAGAIDYFVKKFAGIDKEKQNENLSFWDKMKNNASDFWENTKYTAGDIELATIQKGWDNAKEIGQKVLTGLGFFTAANKDIITQVAKQGLTTSNEIINSVQNPIKINDVFTPKKAQGETQPEPANLAAKIEPAANLTAAKNETTETNTNNGKPTTSSGDADTGGKEGAKIKPVPAAPKKEKNLESKGTIPFVFPVSGWSGPIINIGQTDELPETIVTAHPDKISGSSLAHFKFSSVGKNKFQFNLDGGGWHNSNGEENFSLPDGDHVLEVKAADSSNQTDSAPSSFSWRIDTQAPKIIFTKRPDEFSSSTEAVFAFYADEQANYECKLNGGEWQTCEATVTFENLNEGENNFAVKGADEIGNESEIASTSWITDFSAPTSTVLDLEPKYYVPGFKVKWAGDDSSEASSSGIIAYDVQYKIGDGDWQDWLSASNTDAYFDIDVPAKSKIYFRVRAKDKAGNLGDWSNESETSFDSEIADHVVISKIQIAGQTADDEFVELYNPTDSDVNLAGYRLKRETASGKEYNLVSDFGDARIKSRSYFLIVHPSGYSGKVIPDAVYSGGSYSVSDDNTAILYNGSSTVDKIGMGKAVDYEGTLADNPTAGYVLIRKASATSTADSLGRGGREEWSGNGYDQNDNQNDFIMSGNAVPKNSDSPSEPGDAAPVIPGEITDLTPVYSGVSSSTIKLAWTSTANGNVGEGAFYEIRYLESAGECDLIRNWRTSLSAEDVSAPASGAGVGQEAVVQNLNPETRYCFGVRIFNGKNWSLPSNIISVKTSPATEKLTELKRDWAYNIVTQTLTPDNNPYYIGYDSTIPPGSVLTIEPGVVIKFGPPYQRQWFIMPVTLYVSGAIRANGTEKNPIIFTSVSDGAPFDYSYRSDAVSGNYWGGMTINGTIDFDHAIVKYGGAAHTGTMVFENNGNDTIIHSRFAYNLAGIDFRTSSSSSPTKFSHNTFSDFSGTAVAAHGSANPVIVHNNFYNNGAGIAVADNSAPVINYNNFSGNGHGVSDAYYGLADPIDAKYNWWGSETGPTYYLNPDGKGQDATDNFDCGGWVASAFENQ